MRVTIQGSISAQIARTQRDVAAALRRAVQGAGQATQTGLREMVQAAGFKDGGVRIAKAWRLKVYPAAGTGRSTWRPAALVYSKAPDIIDGFNRDQIIKPKGGGDRLAIPTKYNLRSMRNGKRIPIFTTIQLTQLAQHGAAKVAPSRRNRNVLIWYLRVDKPGPRQRRSWVERKYRFGTKRLSAKGIARRWVPMFVMIRPFFRHRRWSLEAMAKQAQTDLATRVQAELAQLARES